MRIAITGGTGSLGQALVHRLASKGLASRVVVLSRDEWKQSRMAQQYVEPHPIRFMLGDVRDRDRLVCAFRGCDIVVAAAALKRVEKAVYDPDEVVKTNILGTMNTVRAAMDAGVRKVIVISSDKSVQSSNVYGGTKFVAEQYAIASNAYAAPAGTIVSALRYGNVVDSRGAVLHIFREQARSGSPLTITDKRMTRFVMTLEDAVDLVLLVIDHMRGGEVFLPVMPSMRITDLAEAVAPGHPVQFAGLRPGGEKLSEVLISEHESDRVKHSADLGVYVLEPSHATWGYAAWPGARVPDGFRYDSATNEQWLGVEELRTLVEGL